MKTNVLEENTTSIFRVENQQSKKQACSMLPWLILDPEDGGHMFLRNVDSHTD
jgi:hypothetical protein